MYVLYTCVFNTVRVYTVTAALMQWLWVGKNKGRNVCYSYSSLGFSLAKGCNFSFNFFTVPFLYQWDYVPYIFTFNTWLAAWLRWGGRNVSYLETDCFLSLWAAIPASNPLDSPFLLPLYLCPLDLSSSPLSGFSVAGWPLTTYFKALLLQPPNIHTSQIGSKNLVATPVTRAHAAPTPVTPATTAQPQQLWYTIHNPRNPISCCMTPATWAHAMHHSHPIFIGMNPK